MPQCGSTLRVEIHDAERRATQKCVQAARESRTSTTLAARLNADQFLMKTTGRNWLLLMLVVSLSWGACPEIVFAQRLGKTPVPTPQLEPVIDRAALTHVVVTNRDPVLALKTLKKRLAEGNHVEAAKILKEFGDDKQADLFRVGDSLYWDADNKLASVLRDLRREFGSNGLVAAEVYEREIGALAKKELDEASRSNSSSQLAIVGRRYYFTAAGFAALDRLASLALDRRMPELAANIWRELLGSPVHAKRVTPGLVMKTGFALAQAGMTDELATFRTTAFKEFGLSAQDRERFDVSMKRVSRLERRAPDDWLVGLGDATQNSDVTGSVPYLNPRWSRSLETVSKDGNERDWQAQLRQWERRIVESEVAPIGVANWPIIAGEQLVVRDMRGVVGTELATGRPVWAYRSQKSMFEVLDELEGETGVGDRPLNEAFLGNTAAGLPSSDGEHVFVVEVLGLRSNEEPPVRAPMPPGDPIQAPRPPRVAPWPGPRRVSMQIRNRLVCLGLPRAEQLGVDRELAVDPLWTAGGDASDRDDPLARHVFRGPPLPVGGAVFVIGEADQELHLLKLDAATGRLQRVTKLCIVEDSPLRRSTHAPATASYILAEMGGTIICPTETGVLVAVDALLGEIKWLYAYCDPRQAMLSNVASHAVLGWADPPHLNGHSVIYLPRIFDQLHCVDRRTGLRQWAVLRDDARSVGTVTDDVVVLVGTDFVRGLARNDGRKVWETKTGLLSGRGSRIGELFVVPLKTGSVAMLELKTGRARGFGRTPIVQSLANGELPPLAPHLAQEMQEFGHRPLGVASQLRPGNLVAHQGHVVSVGPRFVTVFAQAEVLKREIVERGRKRAALPRDELMLADLELMLGETEAGQTRLDRLMSAAGTGAASTDDRDLARATQRQVVIALLDRAEPESSGLQQQRHEQLERLEALSQSPDEQAQALALRIESGLGNRAWLAVGTAARELSRIRADEFVGPRDSQQFVVRGGALAERAMTRAWSASAGLERDRLTQLMRADLAAAQRENSLASLSRFARLHASSAEADRVRNQVADRLLLANRRHEAESVLRRNLECESVVERAAAHLLMATLLSQSDLHGEAARMLESLQASVGEEDVSGVAALHLGSLAEMFDLEPLRRAGDRVVTVAELRGTLRRELPLWAASRQLQPIDWPVRGVTVVNRSTSESRTELADKFSLRRHELAEAQDIDIFQESGSSDGDLQHWTFGDRRLGTVHGRLSLPVLCDVDFRSMTRSPLHVMPIGSIGALQGVSFLETHNDEPLWKLRYPQVERTGEMLKVGPVTAKSCIFYSRRHLICVEAATGQVRWRRSDLATPTGVSGDVNFLGDDEVLTVFQGLGNRDYTSLAMGTGEVLGSGQVAFDPDLNVRLALGRKLAYVHLDATGGNRRRFRIWDPLHDRFDLDEEFAKDALNPNLTKDGQLYLLKRDGHFRLFSPTRAEPEIDVLIPVGNLEPERNGVLVSVDRDLVLVNVTRRQGAFSGRRLAPLPDSGIPMDLLRYGSLVGIDRQSGRVLWHLPEVQTRSVLRMADVRLPFLVLTSNVQPAGSSDVESLEIEVLDRRTGAVLTREVRLGKALAIPNSAEPSRLVHYELDREAGRLSLYGLSRRKDSGNVGLQRNPFGMVTRVDLDFSRPIQRILREGGEERGQ